MKSIYPSKSPCQTTNIISFLFPDSSSSNTLCSRYLCSSAELTLCLIKLPFCVVTTISMLAQVALHLLLPGSVENSHPLVNPLSLLLLRTIVAHSQLMSLACWRGVRHRDVLIQMQASSAPVHQRINNKGAGQTHAALLCFHSNLQHSAQARTRQRKSARGRVNEILKQIQTPATPSSSGPKRGQKMWYKPK